MGFSVNTQAEQRRPLADRLSDKCEVSQDGCWNWTGAVTQHGYGRMSYRNHVYRTHRLAAHLWLGLDLNDSETAVCHTCDNPPCFNPDHLYLGSQKENVQDMVTRGRAYKGPDQWSHCKKGHALTSENRRGRRCRTCENKYQRSRKRACSVCGLVMAASSVYRHERNVHGVRAIANALGEEA